MKRKIKTRTNEKVGRRKLRRGINNDDERKSNQRQSNFRSSQNQIKKKITKKKCLKRQINPGKKRKDDVYLDLFSVSGERAEERG